MNFCQVCLSIFA